MTLSPAVLGPVPSLELPKAQTSGIPPRQSTYARRLTKAEQKEQHEQIYLVFELKIRVLSVAYLVNTQCGLFS